MTRCCPSWKPKRNCRGRSDDAVNQLVYLSFLTSFSGHVNFAQLADLIVFEEFSCPID